MKNVLTVFCLSITFLILSCKSEEEPTTGLKLKNIESLVQTYTLDLETANNSISFQTDAGCEFSFSSNAFTLNGSEVTGEVNIEVVEVFEKGPMAITGKHTMTDDSILISAGEFYVQAYQGENKLDYKYSYRINCPIEQTGDYTTDLQLFTGGEELNSTQNWVSAPNNSDTWGVFETDGFSSHSLIISGFGWFNCDRFYDDPRPLINLDVKVSSEFTGDNSTVYLAIKNEKRSLGIATRGKYPIGLEVHLIFVSELDDQFLYQIISTTVNEDEYKFERDKMQTATPEELKDIINDLE